MGFHGTAGKLNDLIQIRSTRTCIISSLLSLSMHCPFHLRISSPMVYEGQLQCHTPEKKSLYAAKLMDFSCKEVNMHIALTGFCKST